MIATWNVGTPLAGQQYDIDGALAARTGEDLHRAIEVEVGFGAGLVVVNGTDVVVGGQTLMTLSEGELDRPTNDGFSRHVNYLIGIARGDTRTLVKSVLRRIVRYAKRRGISRTGFRDYMLPVWDATTVDGD